MWIFPKAIILTIMPRFNVEKNYCVNARPAGEDKRLKKKKEYNSYNYNS